MAIVFTSEPVAKNTTTKNLDLIKAAECKLQEKSVEYTQNAEFEVLPDEGYDGMSKVNVSVDVVVPTVQASKAITITQNGPIEILPDSDYDVMEKVEATINVPAPTLQSKHITIDKNISMTEITPDSGYGGLSRVEVDVEIPVEDNKQVSINQNGTTTIIPGDGYDYIEMCDVIVNVPTYNIEDTVTRSTFVSSDGTQQFIPSSGYDAMKKLTLLIYIQYSINNPGVSLAYYQQNNVPDNIIGWESLTDGSYKCASSELKTFDKTLSSLNIGSEMFLFCSSLETFSSDLSALTEAENMFGGCFNIKNITLTGTLDVDLNLGGTNSTRITVNSLMSVINALVDLTGQVEKTQTIGSANLAKLTDKQKEIATNKNWILA